MSDRHCNHTGFPKAVYLEFWAALDASGLLLRAGGAPRPSTDATARDLFPALNSALHAAGRRVVENARSLPDSSVVPATARVDAVLAHLVRGHGREARKAAARFPEFGQALDRVDTMSSSC